MQNGDPQAKALAEQVDKERKATFKADAPGEPAAVKEPSTPPFAQATGQREGDRATSPARANSPSRGSPLTAEQGTLAELREIPADLAAVPETPDEEMEDVNGNSASQDVSPGEALGADASAVEEARKRIHATLDAGEDPLTPNADREGHDVIERLHLRPAAKASRETPEERLLDTEPPQGNRKSTSFIIICLDVPA
eukprot:2206534-Amphidinium_carterae.1